MKVETGRTGFEREDRKSGIRKLAFLLACPLTSVARFAAGLQGKPAELGGWDKVMSRGKEYCWGRSFRIPGGRGREEGEASGRDLLQTGHEIRDWMWWRIRGNLQ